ncbi:MAG TPA: phosphonate C-P lyase system protein PhnL [Firmicutes bacterium]|jgi:alpha-D-ribose 1-methylphosphonate 5-triphosphate synthase subunit PhnL|nr:phosphonate C-P lyase system protein PhnL [Bacillota bacterium]
MNPILQVSGLEKDFCMYTQNEKIIKGCQELNFFLNQGQFLGIYGPSGAGKSTILKCIYRTYLPSAGRMIYHSKLFGKVDLAAATEQQILALRHQEMGYISQFLQVIPRVSAQQIVAEGLINRGAESGAALAKAQALLGRLNLPAELWDACPSTFSGGERQRVNIARGVISKPRLLLLDEPTASLDIKMQHAVLQILAELKQEGTTMIGIFHDLDLMRQIADLKLSMVDGALTAVA